MFFMKCRTVIELMQIWLKFFFLWEAVFTQSQGLVSFGHLGHISQKLAMLESTSNIIANQETEFQLLSWKLSS